MGCVFALDRFGVNNYSFPSFSSLTTTERIFFMNNFNFFDWMRNGVKTAVLGGVNDAVELMGMPQEDTAKDKILSFLKTDNETPGRPRITHGAAPAGTKKLGRGLSEIATKEAS
jgi:hypothetical protein